MIRGLWEQILCAEHKEFEEFASANSSYEGA